jgi:hypothetical protein
MTVDIADLKKGAGNRIIEIINYISDRLSLPLHIAPDIAEKIEHPIDRFIPETGTYSLEEILNRVLHSNQMDYHLAEGSLEIIGVYDERNPKLELYDVSDLIGIAADRQFDFSTEENFCENDDTQYQVFGLNFEEMLSHDLYYTESSIARLIEENIYQGYNSPHAIITSSPGKLFISNTPSVHQEIQQFLDTLRQRAQMQLVLETTLIVCKNSVFKQLPIEFSTIYNEKGNSRTIAFLSPLSPEQEQCLFSLMKESKDAFCIPQKPLYLHHLESRYILHASRTHFLAGYDSASGQNRIGRMYEGVIARVMPYLSKDKATLDLEVSVAMVSKPVASIPVPEGEVAIPSQLTQHLDTQLSLSDSTGVLLAGFANPYEDEGKKSFLPQRKKDQLMFYFKGKWE